MDFALLAARLVLDEIYPVQFPDIAIQALLDGAEAPSFMLLAGESGSAPPAELRALLVAALGECGVPLPEPVAAARTVKRDYAQQVVGGALSPTGRGGLSGCSERSRNCYLRPPAMLATHLESPGSTVSKTLGAIRRRNAACWRRNCARSALAWPANSCRHSANASREESEALFAALEDRCWRWKDDFIR